MAQAQVIVTGVDRTKAAITSAIAGMKSLERTAKITAKATRLAFFGLGFFTMDAVAGFEKLAGASKQTEEGAEAIKKLKAAVNDPVLKEAASSITDTLVNGFTKVVELTAGMVRNLNNIGKTDIFKNPENLAKLFAAFSGGVGGIAIGQMLAAAEAQATAIESGVGAGRGPRRGRVSVVPQVDEMTRMENYHKASMERLKKEKEAQEEAAEEAKKLAKELSDLNVSTMTAFEKAAYDFDVFSRAINRLMAAGMLDANQASTRIIEYLDKVLPEYEVESRRADPVKELKKQTDEMTAFAEAAAQNMQTAFADFLFDPFQDGLRGMLRGFIDTIRRMIAEIAASYLLKQFFSWMSGLGGFWGKIGATAVDSLSTRAMGGPVTGSTPYLVGERGPELFVPNTSGSIVPNHAMGGVTVSPVYNIDARGATADLQKALPGIMAENNRRIFDELDRRYGIGR
jgi:hypothetical protein